MKLAIMSMVLFIFLLGIHKSVAARKPPINLAAVVRNMESEMKLMKAELKQLKDDNAIESEMKSMKAELKHLKDDNAMLHSLMTENQQKDRSMKLSKGFKYSNTGTIVKINEDEPSSQFVCPLNGTICINKLYPNVYDCTNYWSCADLNGCNPVLINCPEPLEFSETEGACVDADESGCTEITTRAPTTELPTTMELTTEPPIITTPEDTPTTDNPCPPPHCFGMQVAFNVRHIENYGPVNIETPIPYNRVDFNVGGGFDPATSIFTAPVSGFYNIYFHQLQEPGGSGVQIAINGITSGYVVDNNGVYFSTTTGVYNLQLNYGDTVYIYLNPNADQEISDSHFGGFLLF